MFRKQSKFYRWLINKKPPAEKLQVVFSFNSKKILKETVGNG